MNNKKRMSLYFNLDVPSDKELWDYLNKSGRKSELIKRLIRNEMNGVPGIPNIQKQELNNVDEAEEIKITEEEKEELINSLII